MADLEYENAFENAFENDQEHWSFHKKSAIFSIGSLLGNIKAIELIRLYYNIECLKWDDSV